MGFAELFNTLFSAATGLLACLVPRPPDQRIAAAADLGRRHYLMDAVPGAVLPFVFFAFMKS